MEKALSKYTLHCLEFINASLDSQSTFQVINYLLLTGTKACEKLSAILMNKRILHDIAKLSPLEQTSSIEAFHSLIRQFAPKNVNYSYIGMLCRWVNHLQHYYTFDYNLNILVKTIKQH